MVIAWQLFNSLFTQPSCQPASKSVTFSPPSSTSLTCLSGGGSPLWLFLLFVRVCPNFSSPLRPGVDEQSSMLPNISCSITFWWFFCEGELAQRRPNIDHNFFPVCLPRYLSSPNPPPNSPHTSPPDPLATPQSGITRDWGKLSCPLPQRIGSGWR